MAAGIVAPLKVMAVQVTIYLTEGDSWHHRPLHLEILKYLREENVFGAVAFHAVAGFLGRGKSTPRTLSKLEANCPSSSRSLIPTSTSTVLCPSCARWPRIG